MRRTLSVVAASALAAVSLTACGAIERAQDCANTAITVAAAVDDLQQAVGNAAQNPDQARAALDRVEESLAELDASAGDGELGAAVDDLRTAVADARAQLEAGEVPDVSGVQTAANDITALCTPGN